MRVANVAEDAATSSKRSYTLRAALPAEPLAGNMVAHFNGTFQGSPSEIPFTEKAAMRWLAVLDIKTGQPEIKTDPVTEKAQTVYPDDGSEWMLRGSYLHERCVPRQPEVCNYWTEETFESDGSIAESGGDLWIVSEGDGVRLEARLPVTVTTTVHDSFLGEQSESRHFWTLSCPSSGRWWGQEPGLTHFPPLNGALHGSWASDDRKVVEFTCHEEWQPWIYGPDSGETSSTSMSLQGRVEVQFR